MLHSVFSVILACGLYLSRNKTVIQTVWAVTTVTNRAWVHVYDYYCACVQTHCLKMQRVMCVFFLPAATIKHTTMMRIYTETNPITQWLKQWEKYTRKAKPTFQQAPVCLKELWYTMQHKTVLISFPVILKTFIMVQMLSVWQRHLQVSGPTVWNSLLLTTRNPSPTVTQFCALLKTVLFLWNITTAPTW